MAERAKLDIRTGDTVKVSQKIQEKGKTRLQLFEGLVSESDNQKVAVRNSQSYFRPFINVFYLLAKLYNNDQKLMILLLMNFVRSSFLNKK